MGACDYVIKIKEKNQKKLTQIVSSKTDDMRSESGSSYSGTWASKDSGVNFINRTFTNYDVAYDYIMEHNNKWDCVDAVKVIEKLGTPTQNLRIEKQKEKVSLARKKVEEFDKNWFANMKNAKSKTKGCKHCGSRKNISNIHFNHCSDCSHTYLTEPQLKRRARLEGFVTKEKEKMESLISKKGGKTNEYFLVGGWCSS